MDAQNEIIIQRYLLRWLQCLFESAHPIICSFTKIDLRLGYHFKFVR